MSKKIFLQECDGVETLETISNKGVVSPDFVSLSLKDEETAKRVLADARKTIAIQVDSRKIALAEKAMDNIEDYLSIIHNPDVKARIMDSINNAFDLSKVMEAIEKQSKILQNLTRVDTIDGSGTPSNIKLAVQFQNRREGTTTSIMLSTEDE